MGQLFSTRSDLFPAAFTDELAKLQDRVPAFAPAKAMAIIQSELGAPAHQLFRTFQERPIAAASLGQVSARNPKCPHRAVTNCVVLFRNACTWHSAGYGPDECIDVKSADTQSSEYFRRCWLLI